LTPFYAILRTKTSDMHLLKKTGAFIGLTKKTISLYFSTRLIPRVFVEDANPALSILRI